MSITLVDSLVSFTDKNKLRPVDVCKIYEKAKRQPADVSHILKIHKKIKRNSNVNMLCEIPEQIMAASHIKLDDCVLEIGCDVGRNTCVINSLLLNKHMHVAVEPNLHACEILECVKKENNLGFHVFPGAIDNRRLIRRQWITKSIEEGANIPSGWSAVRSASWEKFQNIFKDVNFNTVVADCEGHLLHIFQMFPSMLNNITKIILEHDFLSENDWLTFVALMMRNNYTCDVVYYKNDKFGPGIKWVDGVRTDPVFVSLWRKTKCK